MSTDGTNTDTAATGASGDAAAAAAATQQNDGTKPEAKGPAAGDAAKDPFAELGLDPETREWVTKREVKDAKSAIELARNQDKMIGDQAKKLGESIRIPGKDATPEEVQAYKTKMGIGQSDDDYLGVFEAPKELPETLPYDGERDKAFAAKANELGISVKAAKELRSWFIGETVADHNGAKQAEQNRIVETGKSETAKLVKLWGPLDGQTAKTNLAAADKVMTEVGGEKVVQAFERVGLVKTVNGDRIVQDADVAVMFSKLGMAIYTEDAILKGDAALLNNPFSESSLNMTEGMRLYKQDRQLALNYIAAAGKTPADFGLKA